MLYIDPILNHEHATGGREAEQALPIFVAYHDVAVCGVRDLTLKGTELICSSSRVGRAQTV